MRKRVKIILSCVLLVVVILVIIYMVDKNKYMSTRIKSNVWEYDEGYYIGDYINAEAYTIKGDTIVFLSGKKVLFKYQYFNFLIISDVEGENKGKYIKIGSHW